MRFMSLYACALLALGTLLSAAEPAAKKPNMRAATI